MPKRARSNSSNGSEAAARKELEKKKRVDAIETAVAVPGNGEGRVHFPKVVLPSETVALDGHSAAVLSLDFEPTMGNCLVTAGMDKVVLPKTPKPHRFEDLLVKINNSFKEVYKEFWV